MRRALPAGAALLLVLAAARAASPPRMVEIVRDAYGVPNLFVAGTGADAQVAAAYATGYVQAEDRLFQMDLFRRAARGRLAELSAVGADFLAMDLDARRDASTEDELAQDLRRLSPRDRRVTLAFRDGVNRFIAEVTADTNRLPLEYLGTVPEPWTDTDTLAIGELELSRFAISGGGELENARLLAELRSRFPEAEARGIFNDLVWIDDPSAPTTIAPEEKTFPERDRIERFAPEQMALLDRFPAAFRAAAEQAAAGRATFRRLAARLPIPAPASHASNAIVVAGRLAAGGRPILLGGPQTGINIPSFFWEVGVHTGEMDSHGVAVPGTPGISMGRTSHLAFTITSAADDDIDVFAEVIDPANPDHYLHDGQSVAFEHRTETFLVAGQAPVVRDYLRTVHGPVIFLDPTAGLAFARRRALDRRATPAGARALRLALSSTLGKFLRIAHHLGAGFNLHVADTEGNIAYVHAGRRPRRPPFTDPRLPLLGTGEQEWRGIRTERPSVVNPASGVIVNWNNKPAAGWPAGDQRELWGVLDRVLGLKDGIDAELRAGRPFTTASVGGIMRHAATADLFASRIVPYLTAAVGALPAATPDAARLTEAAALITAWVDDGAPLVAVGDTLPHPGATLYRAFRTAAQRLVFADELGTALHEMSYPLVNEGNQEDDHGSYGTPDALFYRALLGSAAALPLSRNYFDDVTTGTPGMRDDVLVASLRAALASLATRFATDDMTAWLEPKLLETYMELGGVGMLFGPTTMERENRGSYNLLVELGAPGGGQIIVPPGESGALPIGSLLPEPPHLRDQLRLFESFTYRRIPDARADIEAPLQTRTLDVPANL
jgi:penicillin G amidase